jgi:cell division protein FtsB
MEDQREEPRTKASETARADSAEVELGAVKVSLREAVKFGKEGVAVFVVLVGLLAGAISSYYNLQTKVDVLASQMQSLQDGQKEIKEYFRIPPAGMPPRSQNNSGDPSISRSAKQPPISELTGYVPQ